MLLNILKTQTKLEEEAKSTIQQLEEATATEAQLLPTIAETYATMGPECQQQAGCKWTNSFQDSCRNLMFWRFM